MPNDVGPVADPRTVDDLLTKMLDSTNAQRLKLWQLNDTEQNDAEFDRDTTDDEHKLKTGRYRRRSGGPR